jgi:hypothetical protein
MIAITTSSSTNVNPAARSGRETLFAFIPFPPIE